MLGEKENKSQFFRRDIGTRHINIVSFCFHCIALIYFVLEDPKQLVLYSLLFEGVVVDHHLLLINDRY